MPDDRSRPAPTTMVDAFLPEDKRAAASWLVPAVLLPIFLAAAIAAQALYRLAHLGPAAFG
jgi:hypothetical protein